MPLRRQLILACFTGVALLASCKAHVHSSQTKLIGGGLASSKGFASLIQIPGCTGVLVDPKIIMTAAHCVHIFHGANAGRISPNYQPGRSFSIGNSRVTIAQTHVHPSWAETCTAADPCDPNRAGAEKNPAVVDMAVIVLTRPVDGIIPAQVDFEPVKISDELFLTGFGCESGIGTDFRNRKKFHKTLAIDGQNALAHAGSQRAGGIAETLSSNFVTPGKLDGSSKDFSALCPGDSGGPVYRYDAEVMNPSENFRLKMVGINADYTFSGQYEKTGSIPVTNIHTRVDAPHIKEWLVKYLPQVDQSINPPNVSDDIFLALAEGNGQASSLAYLATSLEIDEAKLCEGEGAVCENWNAINSAFTFHAQVGSRKFFKSNGPISIKAGRHTLLGRVNGKAVSVMHIIDIQAR